MVDETNFVLVNIYNFNTETKEVATLLDLDKIFETIKDFYLKLIDILFVRSMFLVYFKGALIISAFLTP